MRKRNLLILFLILTAAWMAMIFSMSSRNADQSGRMSLAVGRRFSEIFVPGYEDMSKEEQTALAEKIDYPVRKAAHMTEYAILAILLSADILIVVLITKYRFKHVVFSTAISALYAVTDEIHQLFVPGRSGMALDVLIDSAGAFLGALIFYGIISIIRKRRIKRT